MKLQFKSSPTIVSDDMAVSTMGMRVERMGMAAQLLRDQTYKDKVLAIVREYTTNAIDTSIEHNVQEPVLVKIDNVDGRYLWSVRDYSVGLDDYDIRNVFGMYFESTKAHSNLFVGCMGIGSKCALSYSDTFYVTSYHNGTKTQYSCMLGGCDESGYPKGEIYEIHSEPTTETGLEVSVDITNDQYNFQRVSTNFVKTFHPDAKLQFVDMTGDVHTPCIPQQSEKIGDYIINQYSSEFEVYDYYTHKLSIRMGGVIYRNDISLASFENPKGKIVVDVPIGKLTVITSREDVEDTPKNKLVLEEIQKVIRQLADDDALKLTTPKFGSELLGNFSTRYNKSYDGKWFTYRFSKVFADSSLLNQRISVENYSSAYNPVNGKYVIYLIPDIKSHQTWVKRLMLFVNAAMPNTRVYWCKKNANSIPTSTSTLDLSDVSFVDVKSLGLPKLVKGGAQTAYLMYHNGYKRGSFSAEDLEEYVSEKYYNNDDITSDWYTKVTSREGLRNRSVGLSGDYGTAQLYWVCNSKKMMQNLIELGWLDVGSKEYQDKFHELLKIERMKAARDNAAYRAKEIMFRIQPSQKTVDAIANKPSNLTRIEVIKHKILREDSIRARILHSVIGYNPKMTREDLRKILNMK